MAEAVRRPGGRSPRPMTRELPAESFGLAPVPDSFDRVGAMIGGLVRLPFAVAGSLLLALGGALQGAGDAASRVFSGRSQYDQEGD